MVLCFFIKTDRGIFGISKQLGGIMAKRLSFLLLILAFLPQTCSRYPSAPQYSGIGDCGKPTIPSNLTFKDSIQYWASPFTGAPESTKYYQVYGYLEIYNYEKELIQTSLALPTYALYTTYTNLHSSGSPYNYDIYWNGQDMNGKKVDNGVYTTKLTLISQADTYCSCGTILLTTN
jgi:hypothetical protein